MEFSEFSKILGKVRALNGVNIVKELIDNITNSQDKYFGDIMDDSISRYSNGGTKFNKLAKTIRNGVDKEYFISYLSDCYESNVKDLINEFKQHGVEINEKKWKEEITQILINIIDKDAGFANDKILSTKEELSKIKDIVIDTTDKDINTTDAMVKETLQNSIKNIEIIQSSKLPEELKDYYTIKYSIINEKVKENIVPTKSESSKKYPHSYKIKLNINNEENKINNFDDLNKLFIEANLDGAPKLIGKVIESTEYFGNIVSPLNNDLKDLLMFALPKNRDQIPNTMLTIRMSNSFLALNLENIKMNIFKYNENNILLTNEKFDYRYILTIYIKLDKEKKNIRTDIKYNVKKEFSKDVKEIMNQYKWNIISNNKEAKLIISVNNKDVTLDTNNLAKTKYSADYINFIDYAFKYLNKLKYIQDELNIEIDVDLKKLFENIPGIIIVESYIRRKNTVIDTPFQLGAYINKELKEYEGHVINEETLVLEKISLFDREIETNNLRIKVINGSVEKVEDMADRKKINIIVNKCTTINE